MAQPGENRLRVVARPAEWGRAASGSPTASPRDAVKGRRGQPAQRFARARRLLHRLVRASTSSTSVASFDLPSPMPRVVNAGSLRMPPSEG